MASCFGVDMHKTLNRCYLTSTEDCTLSLNNNYNEYSKQAVDPGYTEFISQSCPGNNVDVAGNENTCYEKCRNSENTEACNGYLSSYGDTSTALCLDANECLALCDTMASCFGVDMHKTLNR